MHWLGWIVVVLALLVGGWFVFDGTHTVVTGDDVAPKTGRYAGQYGPWAKAVSAVGITPNSALIRTVFVGYGVVWIGVMIAFAVGARWARRGMLACAIGSLWYLPFGTLLRTQQIVLLIVARPLAGSEA